MRTSGNRAWEGLENLERRIVLSHLPIEVYYPEGFAHDGITESVAIDNPNDAVAEFELWARYEVGERDQLLASGTLAPRERRDIAISSEGQPDDRLVRESTPYALVLQSDRTLSATFLHDDFGGATAEAFTDRSDDRWTLARVAKGDDNRDFIVFFNPGAAETEVEVELVDDTGFVRTLRSRLEGGRRGGWNLHFEDNIPEGEYSARVSSTSPIVLARSLYQPGAGRATGHLASAGLGATAGAVLSVEFEDRLVDFDDDDFDNDDTVFIIFNPNQQAATVTLFFLNRDDDSPFNGQTSFAVVANPEGRTHVSLRSLGHEDSREVSMVYTSTVPVVVEAHTERRGALFSTPAVTTAATEWFFSQGRFDRLESDEIRTEDIFVFNPNASSVNVTVTFFFSNGQVVTEQKSLDPLEIEDIDARIKGFQFPDPELRYAAVVQATGAVVASLEHWDRNIGGDGFTVHGQPGGTVFPLSQVLDL